jgi:hypothetical protein
VAVRQLRQPVRESDALFGRQLLASRRLFQQRALAPVGVTLHQGALAGAVTRLFLGRAQGHPGNVTALERGCQALATSGEANGTESDGAQRPVNATGLEPAPDRRRSSSSPSGHPIASAAGHLSLSRAAPSCDREDRNLMGARISVWQRRYRARQPEGMMVGTDDLSPVGRKMGAFSI